MSLSHMNTGTTTDGNKMYFTMILLLLPVLIENYSKIYNFIIDLFMDKNKIVSIKLKIHSANIFYNNGTYGKQFKSSNEDKITSTKYIALLEYIKDNIHTINNVSQLTEFYNSSILEVSEFIMIPLDSNEILLDHENKIYCNVTTCIEDVQVYDKTVQKKRNEILLFIKIQNKKETNIALVKLNNFLDNCVKKYNIKKLSKYDGKKWIYVYSNTIIDANLPKLIFNEYELKNNKDLETNIYFDGKEKLIKYVNKFIYDEDEVLNQKENKYEMEYKSLGYSYKATFLFYGSPGCGKTSTIKAILNKTKRNAVIFSLSNIKTSQELERLFRCTSYNGKTYDQKELCYIIEDCDASENNILFSRKDKKTNDKEKEKIASDEINESINKKVNNLIGEKINESLDKLIGVEESKKDSNNENSLSLDTMLNILDGVIELHGTMIIFTSNHPEKLDEAFLRPGRIDFKQEFKKASINTIEAIVKNKFKGNYQFPKEKFINEILSPAEIQSICFNNDNLNSCIQELILEQNKKTTNLTSTLLI